MIEFTSIPGAHVLSAKDGAEYIPGRRMGNTTRIIEKAIELLGCGIPVEIQDHERSDYDSPAREVDHDYVLRQVVDRLRDYPGVVLVDRQKRLIQLK